MLFIFWWPYSLLNCIGRRMYSENWKGVEAVLF